MRKRLGDIAEIRTGYLFRGRVEAMPDSNVVVIQIKDVDEHFKIHTDDLTPVRLDNPQPHLLEPGDVLFLARGQRQYAAVVPPLHEKTIATGYFLVLRLKFEIVDPEFLAWYLNHQEFQAALKPLVSGTHMPFVSKSLFQDLPIRIPPLDVQQRISTLHNLATYEKQLSESLASKRQLLVQAIATQLMNTKHSASELFDEQ
jgi:restriction endonuclease S subunit